MASRKPWKCCLAGGHQGDIQRHRWPGVQTGLAEGRRLGPCRLHSRALATPRRFWSSAHSDVHRELLPGRWWELGLTWGAGGAGPRSAV